MDSMHKIKHSVHLPQEIITEILINLPVRSLLRFSLVSKSWLWLTSNPYFIKSHLRLPARKTFALTKLKDTKHRTRVFPPLVNGQKPLAILQLIHHPMMQWYYEMDIVGSCDGLVCASVSNLTNYLVTRNSLETLILWNPATKKFKELPSTGIRILVYGFGYDASSDDYKVVVSNDTSINYFYVYSFKSNTWRIIDLNAKERVAGYAVGPGVFVNGSIHWQWRWRTQLPDNSSEKFRILAYNLTTEACVVMAAPNSESRGQSDLKRLGVSEDYLCYACLNDGYLDYWMMKEYGVETSWTKNMRIPYALGSPVTPVDKRNVMFKVPKYDESSGKSQEMWMIEQVCCFDEVPSTSDYMRFECATYKESLVAVSNDSFCCDHPPHTQSQAKLTD